MFAQASPTSPLPSSGATCLMTRQRGSRLWGAARGLGLGEAMAEVGRHEVGSACGLGAGAPAPPARPADGGRPAHRGAGTSLCAPQPRTVPSPGSPALGWEPQPCLGRSRQVKCPRMWLGRTTKSCRHRAPPTPHQEARWCPMRRSSPVASGRGSHVWAHSGPS